MHFQHVQGAFYRKKYLEIRCILKKTWIFVVKRSRRPHNCKTGHFTLSNESVVGRERMRTVQSKNDRTRRLQGVQTVFHRSICKSMTFLISSSWWWSVKLPFSSISAKCDWSFHITRAGPRLTLCMTIIYSFNYQSASPTADLQSRSVMLSVWLQKSKACAVQFHNHHTSSCRISSPVAHPSACCSLPRRYNVLGRAKFHPSDLK